MKLRFFILFAFFLVGSTGAFAQQHHAKEILYVGTFSLREIKGIYLFEFDRSNKKLTELQSLSEDKRSQFPGN